MDDLGKIKVLLSNNTFVFIFLRLDQCHSSTDKRIKRCLLFEDTQSAKPNVIKTLLNKFTNSID
jgi:hypothetical protein